MTGPDDAIARFMAYELSARGRSRLTVEAYARDLAQFFELSGAASVAGIDRNAVLAWVNAQAALELSPRSRARKLSALRTFVAWAVEFGLLSADPVPKELTTPQELYLPDALTEEEVAAIIKAAQPPEGVDTVDPQDLRDYAVIETLYATGMRVSELTGLRLHDLQLGEAFAMVTGKGDKQRLVPLGQYAIDALGRYLSEARGRLSARAGSYGEVFLSKRGPISRSTVFRIVKKYAELAGVRRRVSPHTFRHSCASHLLAHGADLRLVQELLGHANLSTTQVYTHIEKSHLREVYNRSHPMA